MLDLAYVKTAPKQTALLKAQCEDFIVREHLGYEFTGDGEFVLVKVRKRDCNTLFVGEKLAQFAGISAKHMSYAGLKDRHALTEQWFCLHMPGQSTPDFSQFKLDGVDILAVTRHRRKLRIGSLAGNYFELFLRQVAEDEEIKGRLERVKSQGVPNYFTEQRFGRDGENLNQALRWAKGEIKVKDRHKRSFYLSAARSALFNHLLSARLQQGSSQQVQRGDIVQLAGSNSWFAVTADEDLEQLQARLERQDLVLTTPLIGEDSQQLTPWEQQNLLAEHQLLFNLMHQQRVNGTRRAMWVVPAEFAWQFEAQGLKLSFYLPAGSYATAVVRELVKVEEN